MKNMALILKFAGSIITTTAIIGGIAGLFGWVAVLEGEALPLLDITGAIVLAIFGAFVYGIGYVMEKKIKVPLKPAVVLDPENLNFIYDTIRKQRNRTLGMTIFICAIVVGLFLAILLTADPRENLLMMIAAGLIGVLFSWAAVRGYIVYSGIKDVRKSELYNCLMYQPESISHLKAVYIKSAAAPGTMGQVINVEVTRDKKKLGVIMISETNLELLRQHVVSKNPGVKFEKINQEV
ncbi:hypothetical protein BH10BAC4_BH10BAC4_14670 [soil metagenome]